MVQELSEHARVAVWDPAVIGVDLVPQIGLRHALAVLHATAATRGERFWGVWFEKLALLDFASCVAELQQAPMWSVVGAARRGPAPHGFWSDDGLHLSWRPELLALVSWQSAAEKALVQRCFAQLAAKDVVARIIAVHMHKDDSLGDADQVLRDVEFVSNHWDDYAAQQAALSRPVTMLLPTRRSGMRYITKARNAFL
jgi:hypothetical protein